MFLGPRITLGAFVPDDYGAMYCWANDIAAARLDGAFRPVNLRDVINCPQFRALAPRFRLWERPAISCRVAVADAIAMRLREGVEVRPTLIDETFAVRAESTGCRAGQRPA
jgi:hypothetical protein